MLVNINCQTFISTMNSAETLW